MSWIRATSRCAHLTECMTSSFPSNFISSWTEPVGDPGLPSALYEIALLI